MSTPPPQPQLQTVDPSQLNIPTDESGIFACLQDIKNVLVAINHNLALTITQTTNHIQDLHTAEQTLTNHDDSIQNLDTVMITVNAAIARLQGTGGGGTSKSLKMTPPSKFNGSDKNLATSFRVAVSHYIRVTSPRASVDEQIAYIISCLEGKAHEWLEPYLEEDVITGTQVPWLHNVNDFWAQFNARWNVQNKTENYRAKFRALKQTKSVQEYFKDFQTYSQNLGYNDVSLRDFFYDGLSVKIKEFLMAQDYDHGAVSYDELTAKALKIAQRIEQFEEQNKGSTSKSHTATTSGSKAATASSTGVLGAVPREKLAVGDNVYMLGTDGKAQKGKIQAIGKNSKGMMIPTIKWNNGTTSDSIFKNIKKDNHPVAVATPAASSSKDKGPAPMELDGTGKGKKPIVCNTCGGKGHYANQCPSKPLSGQGAELSSDSENEDE